MITRDPRSGKRNVGMYRMQVYDGQTTGMHWQRQKVAAEHLRERLRAAAAEGADDASAARVQMMAETAGGTARASGSALPGKHRLEVAVVIGTDPATDVCGHCAGAA